jgi:hypothetical protein
MRRRDLITIFGAAAVWPLVARAQKERTPVVGFLHYASQNELTNLAEAVRRGLKEVGYVEGVRRQGLWDNGLIRIREALAHRIGDFRQPTAGAAGGGF